MSEQTTNPVDGEAMPEVVDAPASENEALESIETNQSDTDGDADEETDPEAGFEEIELDGEAYRVPPKLKEAVLRHKDYTQKTQEVAELRKATESRFQAVERTAALQAEFAQDISTLGALNAKLEPFNQVRDWPSYIRTGGAQAQADYAEYQALVHQRDGFVSGLGQRVQQRQAEEQRETARQIEQGRAEIAKYIKGYTPEVANKLADFGTNFGFSREEILQAESDPRSIRILHLAWLGQQSLATQKTTQRVQQQQALQPVKTIGAKSVPAQGLSDRLGMDAWMDRRTSELRKAKR